MTAKTVSPVSRAKYIKAKGFQVGQGMFRRVYKTPRGKWVLKVNRDANAPYGSNKDEYKTYLKLKAMGLPKGVKIPEMHMLPNGDLLAEYIKGHHPAASCSPGWHSSDCEGRETCYATRFEGWNSSVRDMHTENVIVGDDGNVYIIDLGFGLD